jgi:menaquinone-specific isochorismate synthase
MTISPQHATSPSGLKPLRHIVPEASHVQSLRQAGALFAWTADRWIIAWGTPEKSARPDRERASFYAPDFYLQDPEPWRIFPETAVVSPDALARLIETSVAPRVWQPFDREAYAASFADAQKAIQRGALRKAVPAVFDTSKGPLTATERAQALHAMANLPAGLMPYGCWNDHGGFIGASPELLFENDSVEIRTMAVAGTAGAGTVPDDILEDPKERDEHQLVLDDLITQLSPLGEVVRGVTRLWRIGILSHLRTDLRLRTTQNIDFDELVRRLHPTPAVATAPRTVWREWISRLDTAQRGSFAAPFGVMLPDGTAKCLVAIRQVHWDAKMTYCGAGCGLVSASCLEREIDELRLKLTATRGNLGL